MKDLLISTTKLVMFLMIVVLSAIMFQSLHSGNADVFKTVFAVFSNILTSIVGFYIGKSVQESSDSSHKDAQDKLVNAALAVPGQTGNTSSVTTTTVIDSAPDTVHTSTPFTA